jgi:membrane-associated phospholipid phosphatase
VLAVLQRRPAIVLWVVVADAAADLLATLGKTVVHRHRPFVHQLGPAASTHSFPSGHTATSVACAFVVGSFAPRLRLPLYVLAALIAFSRLYNGDHFPLDVLGGALLGAGVGWAVTALSRRPWSSTGARPGRGRSSG